VYGQNSAGQESQIRALDNAVKVLAAEIQKTLPAGESPKVALGIWNYHNLVPALGRYWAAQLVEELTNLPGRSFVLIAGDSRAPDLTLSGEIVDIAGVIRVYTQLIRFIDHSLRASFHTDFELTNHLAEMLSGGGGRDAPSSSIIRDIHEPDSRENPLAVEIAANDGGPVINRTIHTENDEDFFLLAPGADGALVMETSGDMDTYMELYNAESGQKLDENDDGASGTNARIRRNVAAGDRYIVKIRGYGSDMGSYGFHAWLSESIRMRADEYEDDNDFDSAKELSPGTVQEHTFTTGNDVDWVKFRIDAAGRYIIRTRGINSSELDTYIELYDEDGNAIDENDDGGQYLDSLLSVRLRTGTYYLKVECLDDEPNEPYTIQVNRED
jgi:hypothetical protein